MKPKKCKICKDKFTPIRPLQMVCSYQCSAIYAKEQKRKSWRKEKKKLKEKLKTRSDYLKEAQKEFNRYIRLRDKESGCISCKKPFKGKYDAGHYRSVGGYPEFRFDENNVHGQCVFCNRTLSANLIEYRLGLIDRIGVENVEKLETRSEIPKWTIDEIKEIKSKYKKKADAIQGD